MRDDRWWIIIVITIVTLMSYNHVSAKDFSVADELMQISQDGLKEIEFSGKVYLGEVGDKNNPISGIKMRLYISNSSVNIGNLSDSTTTNVKGFYKLAATRLGTFYSILLTQPLEYAPKGVISDGGQVINASTIRYDNPLKEKTLVGNDFWISHAVILQSRSCPDGCECMFRDFISSADFSKWVQCSSEMCGGNNTYPKFCYRSLPDCAEGCECMKKEAAEAAWGKRWQSCSSDVCGYNKNQPMYCFRSADDAPICPEGCECYLDRKAALEYDLERCGAKSCGFDINGQPLYCYKSLVQCSEECNNCMTPSDAAKFGYKRCGAEVCDFDENKNPLYCYFMPSLEK